MLELFTKDDISEEGISYSGLDDLNPIYPWVVYENYGKKEANDYDGTYLRKDSGYDSILDEDDKYLFKDYKYGECDDDLFAEKKNCIDSKQFDDSLNQVEFDFTWESYESIFKRCEIASRLQINEQPSEKFKKYRKHEKECSFAEAKEKCNMQ